MKKKNKKRVVCQIIREVDLIYKSINCWCTFFDGHNMEGSPLEPHLQKRPVLYHKLCKEYRHQGLVGLQLVRRAYYLWEQDLCRDLNVDRVRRARRLIAREEENDFHRLRREYYRLPEMKFVKDAMVMGNVRNTLGAISHYFYAAHSACLYLQRDSVESLYRAGLASPWGAADNISYTSAYFYEILSEVISEL